MNSLKTRFHLRSLLSFILSLSLIWGSLSPLAWAGIGAEENAGHDAPIEMGTLDVNSNSLMPNAEIGTLPISVSVELAKPSVLMKEGFWPKAEKKLKKLGRAPKSRSKEKSLHSFKKGFQKFQKKTQAALGRKNLAVSKSFLDRFFGEKAGTGKLEAGAGVKELGTVPNSVNSLRPSAESGTVPNSVIPEVQVPDSYGGPSYKKMTLGGQILYGLKWGFIMQGISHLIVYAISQILNSAWVNHLKLNWLLGLTPEALQKSGHAELLIHDGPAQIMAALNAHAGSFLSWGLFSKAALEEIHYRGFLFGGVFLAAAAARPTFNFISKKLSLLPDFFSPLKNRLPKALNWIGKKITSNAFFVAAGSSAVLFAKAHLAAWGAYPLILAQLGVMGAALSFVVYRSRSLISSTVAHYAYNFLWLLGTWIALSHFASPAVFKDYRITLAVASLGVLGFAFVKSLYQKFKKGQWDIRKLRQSVRFLIPALLIAVSLGISGSEFRANVNSLALPAVTLAVPSIVAQVPAIEKFSVPEAPRNLPSLSPKQIIEKVKPAVLKVYSGDGRGLGTGYLISPSGIALTNAHVAGDVPPGTALKILINGIPSVAEVLAIDHQKDIAILRLPTLPAGQNYPYISIARTAPVMGDKVIALGYPYDVGLTASRGIVSRLGNGPEFLYDYIQTDASINPGNSGGPLLNSKGELVGMDVAIYTPAQEGGSVGIGFAIAANELLDAVSEYQAVGNIDFAHLGIIASLRPAKGVQIDAVRPGSPAAAAKLRPGDVIARVILIPIGGMPMVINTPNFRSLEKALVHLRPGDPASLVVRRGNVFVTLPIIFGAPRI